MNRSCVVRFAVIGVLLMSGCSGSHEAIRDIRGLKQDHNAYMDGREADIVMCPEEQRSRDREYNEKHFSPWHRDRPRGGLADMAAEFDKYGRNPGYGENGRRHTGEWIRELRDNARLHEYSGGGYPAITIRPSSLRSLPTEKPHYNSSCQSMSGHPFDNLQATAVTINTPVFISHVSRDGEWVWAETGYYFGWMRAQDAAFLPDGFTKKWETGRYAVIVWDKMPVRDEGGLFLFRASMGAFFPLVNEAHDGMQIFVAVADQDRRAVLKLVKLPKDAAAVKPLPLTAVHMARLANQLINQPYGWGGLHGNRDCSAMTRDLLAPFGIWLPRNSGDQAMQGGRFIDLSGLSEGQKEKIIASEGVPYLTLLWRRGHIMLYMGVYNGEPLVFHNLWGVSTRTFLGRRGKVVVGHAAITTLHPGRELPHYDKAAADLLANIAGMTLLVGPGESRTLQD